MQLKEYVASATRTEAAAWDLHEDWGARIASIDSHDDSDDVNPIRLLHATVGFSTELYELEFEVVGPETFNDSLHEEVGDICWYHAIATDTLPEGTKSLSQEDLDRSGVGGGYLDFGALRRPKDAEGCLHDLRIYMGIFSNYAKALAFYGRTHTKDEVPIRVVSILKTCLDGILNTCAVLLELESEFTLEQVRQMNIDKLRARFPKKFTSDAANERADKEAGVKIEPMETRQEIDVKSGEVISEHSSNTDLDSDE